MTLTAGGNLGDVEIIVPQKEEKDVLNKLEQSYTKISEMSNEEREFLTALILRTNPKKLLEVGVSAGGSSIVMLNAIKDISNAALYSIDYAERHYNYPENLMP
jgi:predicted O-methyltransferase YrrM